MPSFFLLIFLISFNFARSQECSDTCVYFIPNTLTPDCDQIDCEVLEVVSNCKFIKFEFTIYNKWAEVVFHSNSPQIKFNCKGHEDGRYIWKLSGEYCNSKIINDTGSIVIIN